MLKKQDPELMTRVGKRIRDYRDSMGLTLRELGDLAEVSYAHIHQVEKGQSSLGMCSLVGLARATGMSPNEILGWKED